MDPITPSVATPSGPPPEAPASDLSGRTLGDFRLMRRLGQGGMGQVYLAEQLSLKRRVALKILRADLAADPASLERFRAEAEAVARATHANIVQVYAVGESDGLRYMALEYVEGRNLRDYLARKGPPDVPLVLSILRQVAAALQRAGELGIVHRDIKPDNILLTRKGEAKVADFGLSRRQAGGPAVNLTQSGVTMGTPLYMSPEQVEGKPVDGRSDIYSLGVTCYHLLAGHPPFRGASAFEVALQHVRSEPEPLSRVRPDLPPALCDLVHRMMAKDPAARPQTGRDLLRELARVRESLSSDTARPMAASSALVPADVSLVGQPATPQGARRRRWLMPALFVLSLVGAAALGLALGRRPGPSAPSPSASPPGEIDDAEALQLNDEQALRRTVEMYLPPAGGGRDVSVGMDLCVKLGLLYLDQDRLDDAERFYKRLDHLKPHKYHVLGRLGLAIVAALRSRPEESNDLFRGTLGELWLGALLRAPAEPRAEGRKPDPDLQRVWQNPRFLFWVSQAVQYNLKNGLPPEKMPALLQRFAKTPPLAERRS
jgi:serine/threonine-protein kinase